MSWNAHDNKKYRGKIDRIYVSLTETYEAEYFINEYLKTRNYAVTDENRHKVAVKMETFPGHAPIMRTELEAFLDKGWRN
jgi:hypothetical protein